MKTLKNYLFFFFFLLIILSIVDLSAGTLNQNAAFQNASSLATDEKVKICLTMIVKNESRIIERCLESAKNVVDCIVICDTGSTDDTVQKIENYMRENGIPGKVYQQTWKNFGYNRTLSVQSAQKTLQELNFPLHDTYLLLLDADMLLQVEPTFEKNALTADSYLMTQKSCSLSYSNTRLIRASLPWECIGVTHEYWGSKDAKTHADLETLVIDDRGDGGCKADKFERDIRLLTAGLIEEPTNERYMFYLAVSHQCLNHFEDAINWYKARISRGGWFEEVWYSKYMIGETYEAAKDWDNALHWYLKAYQENPSRAEPLKAIAHHYREEGQNNLAYMYAKQGSRIPYPKGQILFVSYPTYDYQFDEEISIAAFYTPFKADGFDSAEKLRLRKNVPSHIKEMTHKNALFYIENLKNTQFKPISIQLPLLNEHSKNTYRAMNPSLIATETGYRMIVRTVNFQQKDGHYDMIEPEDPRMIRTRNFLVDLDRNLNVVTQNEIMENTSRERFKSWAEGVDDCRLFTLNKKNWFTGTSYDTTPQNTPQVCLGQLEDKPKDNKVAVRKFIPLKGPDPTRCEKNWMPFIKDDSLHIVYSYDPFIVYKTDPETGENRMIISKTPTHDLSRLRGSASPIPFDNGYLMLVHEVIFADNKRYYTHRFLFLDKDLTISKLSKPFTFQHKGVEYSCGMTMDHSGKNLLIGVGIEDREAHLCTVDLETVRSTLESLP